MAQTFTLLYDSDTTHDFDGSKTLSQLGITAQHTVSIAPPNLSVGPETVGLFGYLTNRALFPQTLKYGRIVAETIATANVNYCLVACSIPGYDYFALSDINTIRGYANTSGSAGNTFEPLSFGSNCPTVPGDKLRFTLDILPDVDNSCQIWLLLENLTTPTALARQSRRTNIQGPRVAGKWGVGGGTNNTLANLYSRVALYSADGAVDLPPATQDLVVCEGDSITQGTPTTNSNTNDIDTGNESYPAKLSRLLGTSSTLVNNGHSGMQVTEMARVYDRSLAPLFNATYHRNILVILGDANDIIRTTKTTQALHDEMVAYLTRIRATGYRIVFVPMWKFVTAPDTTRIQADCTQTAIDLRTMMLASASAYDALADPNTDAHFSDATTNSYLTDGLHLTLTGAAFLAGIVQTAINGLPSTADPYQSDNATPVQVLADYKPSAPNPFAASGLGTVLLPTVLLTCPPQTDLNGGRLVFLRRLPGSNAAFVIVGMTTGIDANTPPTPTFTDTTVSNGVRYEYTAYALPVGDF